MTPWIRNLAYRLLPRAARVALMKAYYLRRLPRAGIADPEAARLASFVSAGDCVLDIGANAGWYTLRLARLVGPGGSVHAFEPAPLTAEILSHVVQRLHLAHVSVHACALSDHEGEAALEVPRDAGGADNLYLAHLSPAGLPSPGAATVRVTTLDVLRRTAFGKVSFIKCDVEGAELQVLRGGLELLGKDRPVLLCEVCGHGGRYGARPEDVFALLGGLGYRAHVETAAGLVPCTGPGEEHDNYVFLPGSPGLGR